MADLPENWIDDIGMELDADWLNDIGIKVNGLVDTQPQSGLFSALPAPGRQGALYLCTDAGLLFRDNGTSWERWGGDFFPMAPIPTSGWIDGNMGTASSAFNKGDLVITAPAVAGYNWRVKLRTLTPAINYTATFHVESIMNPGVGSWRAGIVLKNSAAAPLIDFSACYDTANGYLIQATKWASYTVVSAHYRYNGTDVAPTWFRFRDDGTTRYFEYSFNGLDWLTFTSIGRTDFITPDQIGVGIMNAGGTVTGTLRLRSMTGIA